MASHTLDIDALREGATPSRREMALTVLALSALRFGLVGCWVVMALKLCLRGTLFLVRLLRGRWCYLAEVWTLS